MIHLWAKSQSALFISCPRDHQLHIAFPNMVQVQYRLLLLLKLRHQSRILCSPSIKQSGRMEALNDVGFRLNPFWRDYDIPKTRRSCVSFWLLQHYGNVQYTIQNRTVYYWLLYRYICDSRLCTVVKRTVVQYKNNTVAGQPVQPRPPYDISHLVEHWAKWYYFNQKRVKGSPVYQQDVKILF